jgi:hypothetical protein
MKRVDEAQGGGRHGPSAKADIAFPLPRFQSPGRGKAVVTGSGAGEPAAGTAASRSRADALCEQGFNRSRSASPRRTAMLIRRQVPQALSFPCVQYYVRGVTMSLKRRMKRTAEKQLDGGGLIVVNGYEITYQPLREGWHSRLPSAGKAAIRRLHAEISGETVSEEVLDEIKALVEAYPYAPVFYNYLTIAYTLRGLMDKARETTEATLARFPDYLFGRLGQAQEAIASGRFDRVKELLGPGLELRELYPARRRYHVSEFAGYYAVVGLYRLERGDRAGAAAITGMLNEVAPDENATEVLVKQMKLAGFETKMQHLARMVGIAGPLLRRPGDPEA